MNKIDDSEINKILEKEYEYLKGIFNEERILGLFAVGNCVRGFASSKEEIKTVMCYLPTFEEVCLEAPESTHSIKYEEYKIEITDIRSVLELALQQDIEVAETIYTEYKIINPRYKNLFINNFFLNRELIFRSAPRTRVDNALAEMNENLSLYKKTKDRFYLFELCRVRAATQLFLDGTSLENCINIKKDYIINYLWSIKEENYTPKLEEIEEDIYKIEEQSYLIKDTGLNEKIIKQGIFEIMKISMMQNIQGEDFLNTLTKTEQKAWSEVKKYLVSGAACVPFSQLIDDTGISRPVFKNLCQKLKDTNVADVVNQGAKGTYIKILDYSIMK